MMPMNCLLVQHGDSITYQWEFFYDEIEGFDYQPGFLYTLKVAVTTLPPDQVAADASSRSYRLLEILDKKQDKRLLINDLWVLTSMNGEAIDIPGNQDRPYIEFHLSDARYMGNDGCNAFQGSIRQITEDRISLEPAESTDQYCEPTPWSRQFMDRLNRVKAYDREGLELDLLDESGQTLLTFKKID